MNYEVKLNNKTMAATVDEEMALTTFSILCEQAMGDPNDGTEKVEFIDYTKKRRLCVTRELGELNV